MTLAKIADLQLTKEKGNIHQSTRQLEMNAIFDVSSKLQSVIPKAMNLMG